MPPSTGRRTHHSRISQRAHEAQSRPAAVRALVLYPLNALAEDQMARLRLALDGSAARAWLTANRSGNRFWFGRYTGWTPVSGRTTRQGAEDELRNELTRLSAMAAAVAGTDAERFFPRLDGAEMWSRWDMQDSPPDILVTNYSMLNIMLMRDVEATIFDQTRQWLRASSEHVFHLVVDELHTYRGTPGTEVAYILRVLIDRLGLTPDSPQLRILASSASLGSDPVVAQQYLQQFFGRTQQFALVSGGAIPIPAGSAGALQPYAATLAAAATALGDPDAARLSAAAANISAACALPPPDPAESPEHQMGSVLGAMRAADALRAACNDATDAQPTVTPRTLNELGGRLFPASTPDEASRAAEAVVMAAARSKTVAGAPVLPLRVHLFFRSIQGVWACSNPACTAVDQPRQDQNIQVGRLYDRPTITCGCGSRIPELLYCEPCGDIFLGGYRRSDPLRPGIWHLVPDDPNIERAPDYSARDRSYESYATYWPARRPDGTLRDPQRTNWQQDTVRREWKAAVYDAATGEIRLARRRQDATGWIYYVPQLHQNPIPQPVLDEPTAHNDRPALCPHCEANWSGMTNAAPIRTQRTGFQKIAQVLSDTLLRDIAPPQAGSGATAIWPTIASLIGG
ncbi:MAG TPA: hypothetical protein PKD49_15315 [Hyphomicrobium sp.]|nr:hypothetical protein [Hyphomicrobium sp.]